MPQVDNPFGPGQIDTSNPGRSIKSVFYALLGFGMFFVLLVRGRQVGEWANSQIDSIVGTNTSGDNPITRGDL